MAIETTSARGDTVHGPPVDASSPGPLEASASPQLDRYTVLGELGRGGMGEVFRVWDPTLRRPVALKVVRPEAKERPEVLARFLKEAHITAQLQHPGAVPIYALGQLPDGRPFYTMEEVRGRTLKEVLEEVHDGSPTSHHPGGKDGPGPRQSWTFRHLIDAFHSVCETIAYAHSQEVVHRDLKPNNIMVGAFGEVLVLDWGLARRTVGDPAERAQGDAPGLHPFEGDPIEEAPLTRVGAITGTPAYMSPEQAFGETDRLTSSSDVYSLGAILYELLCGRPPYHGDSAWEVLGQVRAGPPPLPRTWIDGPSLTQTLDMPTFPSAVLVTDRGSPAIDAGEGQYAPPRSAELEAICLKAMAREPSARYPHAGLLAREVKEWLDGARRQEQALEIVGEAERLLPEIAERRTRATALRSEAAGLIAQLEPGSPVEERGPAWALEDEAERLEGEATLKEAECVQRLHAAAMHQPGLLQACDRLADFYHEQHALAEAARDERRAVQSQELLRMYDRGRYAAYLKGDGAISLVTDPAGAEVQLFRYELKGRRLVSRFVRDLGRTPIVRESVPMGSYLVVLKSPRGGPDVRYPVSIGREQHWDGVPPGATAPLPVYLPGPGELGPDDIYVPAGWFQCGWDGLPNSALPMGWQWVDGFVVRRFPVTHLEYRAYLNELVAQGRTPEALVQCPQTYGASVEERGEMMYEIDEHGRFQAKKDALGFETLDGYPVTLVDWHQAQAFTRWMVEREDRPWRLLLEPEWEKAARGVDARLCPWGNFPEPSWSHGFSRWKSRITVSEVDTYPLDESPYGVRGMCGNVRDWCESLFDASSPKAPDSHAKAKGPGEESTYRVIRGGSWQNMTVHWRLVARFCAESASLSHDIGFRLARPLGPRS